MKIYIFADLEGISGISGKAYISKSFDRPDLIALGREYMGGDINACITGCIRAGADKIIVKDCHGGGFNVTRKQIDSRADFIDGTTPRERYADIAGSDGLILLGYHAMAGTFGAILEHTYNSSAVQNIWLNGRKVGETGIDAAIAAEYGVPVIMVSGDDKLCIEAADWIPGVVTCEVKKGFSCNGARLPSLKNTRKLIEDKTVEAIGKIKQIPTIKVTYPVKYRIELIERSNLPWNTNYKWLDGRTFELEADSVEKAWSFSF
jgi:D-amino peptidase